MFLAGYQAVHRHYNPPFHRGNWFIPPDTTCLYLSTQLHQSDLITLLSLPPLQHAICQTNQMFKFCSNLNLSDGIWSQSFRFGYTFGTLLRTFERPNKFNCSIIYIQNTRWKRAIFVTNCMCGECNKGDGYIKEGRMVHEGTQLRIIYRINLTSQCYP